MNSLKTVFDRKRRGSKPELNIEDFAASDPDISTLVLSGWVNKKASFIKNKKLWATLVGNILSFWKDPSTHQVSGSIRSSTYVDLCTAHQVLRSDTPNAFDIITDKDKTTLVCESKTECDIWIKELRSAMQTRPRLSSRGSSIDRSSSVESPSLPNKQFADNQHLRSEPAEAHNNTSVVDEDAPTSSTPEVIAAYGNSQPPAPVVKTDNAVPVAKIPTGNLRVAKVKPVIRAPSALFVLKEDEVVAEEKYPTTDEPIYSAINKMEPVKMRKSLSPAANCVGNSHFLKMVDNSDEIIKRLTKLEQDLESFDVTTGIQTEKIPNHSSSVAVRQLRSLVGKTTPSGTINWNPTVTNHIKQVESDGIKELRYLLSSLA